MVITHCLFFSLSIDATLVNEYQLFPDWNICSWPLTCEVLPPNIWWIVPLTQLCIQPPFFTSTMLLPMASVDISHIYMYIYILLRRSEWIKFLFSSASLDHIPDFVIYTFKSKRAQILLSLLLHSFLSSVAFGWSSRLHAVSVPSFWR